MLERIMSDKLRFDSKEVRNRRSMILKYTEENKGSITVEAAIIVPFVICICLLIISLSTNVYKHSRMQDILNEACLELSYDSYLLYEMGIVDLVHNLNKSQPTNNISIEEIKSFAVFMENEPLTNVKTKLKEELAFDNPIDIIKSGVESLEFIDNSMYQGIRVKDTLVDEGVYLITTSFARAYLEDKIKSLLEEENLKVEFVIDHLEMYNYDDSGVVVISYSINLPFNILTSSTIKQRNSSYLQIYNGHGQYTEQLLKDIELSTYGQNTNATESVTDEDGYYKKVFKTKSGARYHKNPLCFHINVNSFPIPLGTVTHKTQCKHCGQVQVTDPNVIVYTTQASDVFHTSPTCHSIYHNISVMSEKEAILKGIEPCGTCSK